MAKQVGFVRVADILPFWRYAVGPTSGIAPAIPFWRLAEAEKLFAEVQHELPWAGAVLYRRRWLIGVETVREYKPCADCKWWTPKKTEA